MTQTTASLQTILGFTDADLDANRAGQLSDSQRNVLLRGWRRTRNILIVAILVLGLAATFILFFGQENQSPVLTFIGMGLTVVNALLVGMGARSYMRTQRDLREGGVTALEGELRHTIQLNVRNRRSRVYALDIAGERLIVPRDTFNAFEERAAYRIYRTPSTQILLTAERL